MCLLSELEASCNLNKRPKAVTLHSGGAAIYPTDINRGRHIQTHLKYLLFPAAVSFSRGTLPVCFGKNIGKIFGTPCISKKNSVNYVCLILYGSDEVRRKVGFTVPKEQHSQEFPTPGKRLRMDGVLETSAIVQRPKGQAVFPPISQAKGQNKKCFFTSFGRTPPHFGDVLFSLAHRNKKECFYYDLYRNRDQNQ